MTTEFRNPMDSIEQGVLSGDWSLVCDGYAAMTGRRLQPPVGSASEDYTLAMKDFSIAISVAVEELRLATADEPEKVASKAKPKAKAKAKAKPRPKLKIVVPDDEDDEDDQDDEDDDEDDEPENDGGGDRDAVEEEPPIWVPPHKQQRDSEANLDKFRVQNANTSGGNNYGRILPFKKGEAVNNWVDDRTVARDDIKIDKKLVGKKKASTRKPPVEMVDVQCSKCEGKEKIKISSAPRRGQDGERSSYVCDRCISQLRPRG